MGKALLTFSNGMTLELHDTQKILPIAKFTKDEIISTGQLGIYEIWCHGTAGLIPSITELLSKCQYFSTLENENKVYSSFAVVCIENL